MHVAFWVSALRCLSPYICVQKSSSQLFVFLVLVEFSLDTIGQTSKLVYVGNTSRVEIREEGKVAGWRLLARMDRFSRTKSTEEQVAADSFLQQCAAMVDSAKGPLVVSTLCRSSCGGLVELIPRAPS